MNPPGLFNLGVLRRACACSAPPRWICCTETIHGEGAVNLRYEVR
jgi:hypothetical protein